MKKNPLKLALGVLAVIGVLALAWMLRWNAVNQLPSDYDEDDYLKAAQEYATLIQNGDWAGFMQFNYRPEHPPLEKIAYGLAIAADPPARTIPDRPTSAEPDKYLPQPHLKHARTLGAVFGALTVLLLALVNPLAGFLMAINAWTIKYTSQVMLESLPAFTSLAAVIAYTQFKRNHKRGWWITSAVFLGLTAASKYMYAMVGVAILLDWFLDTEKERPEITRWLKTAVLWGLLAIVIFFLFDPYLWPDPLGRLKESILYHASYSTGSQDVQKAGYPFYQPLIWLFFFPVSNWHPEIFTLTFDQVVATIACFGLGRLWKKERVYVLWLIIGLGFLLVWPTKWPQYVLLLTAPISLAASEAILSVWEGFVADWKNRRAANPTAEKNDFRRALPWLIPGLIAFGVLTLFPLIYQGGMSLTDFYSGSIRDGLQGGVWREVIGGITGKIQPVPLDEIFTGNKVQYIGPAGYKPIFSGWLLSSGILAFNILWTLFSVGLQTVLGVGAALLLWQKGVKMRRAWQALFILPWAIPEMIGVLMWYSIFAPVFGWLTLAVQKFGKDIPFAFFTNANNDPGTLFLLLLIIATWYGFPFMMLAASAGLKMLPEEVYDAVALDGASAWQTFRFITWPLLTPLVIPAIIIRAIFAFNQFYLFQVSGFYGNRIFTTIATMSFNIFNPTSGFGRNSGLFAVSAILNILTMLILVVFIFIFNRQTKASEGVDYA